MLCQDKGGTEGVMSKWKLALKKIGAFALAGIIVLGMPMNVDAWELDGESTFVNDIETKDPNSLITTIQTNFHAEGTSGFVVLTPSSKVDSILGLSEELLNTADGRGIIYIANNNSCGPNAIASLEAAAKSLGGEIVQYYEILLFKWEGTWNEPQPSTSSPLKMAIGIPSYGRASNSDYAMVNLKPDGTTTIYKDIDVDDYTLTFEADLFSAYAMVKYPKGTEVENATTSPAVAAPETTAVDNNTKSNNSDLDDVPKTGDLSSPIAITLIVTGLSLMTIVAIRRKKSAI